MTKFTQEKILLATRKGEICVTGENLSVKKYADGDVYIRGKIYALTLPEKEGKEC